MEKNTPDTLFRETMARLKTGFGLGIHRDTWKRTGAQRIRFQSDMLKAQRIVLDRSFIRAAVATSTLEPGLLVRRLSMMRPPYPFTWIEWDEDVRLAALRELKLIDPKNPNRPNVAEDFVADRVGVLLQYQNDTMIMRTNGQEVGRLQDSFSMQTIIHCNVEGKDLIDCSAMSIGWKDTPIIIPSDKPATTAMSMRAALGRHYGRTHGVPLDEHNPLAPYITAGIGGPFAGVTYSAVVRERREGKANLLDAMVQATEGDWRFIASVLLLWSVRGPVLKPAGAGSPVSYAGLGPLGNETKIVRRGVGAPQRVAGEAGDGTRAPPREYTYQGHWCYSHKNPGKKWWRRAGTRGNRERGVIEKVYQAEGPQHGGNTP